MCMHLGDPKNPKYNEPILKYKQRANRKLYNTNF